MLGLRLLLYLDLLWLWVRMVLELWGSISVFTKATGLSCTVNLTQGVQCLVLRMLQQVCLALREGTAALLVFVLQMFFTVRSFTSLLN